MSIVIGETTFDHVSYDADGDVLYVSVSGVAPAHWEETPEGHALRFDAEGNLCGITFIGVRHNTDSGGNITITIPHKEELGIADLVPA